MDSSVVKNERVVNGVTTGNVELERKLFSGLGMLFVGVLIFVGGVFAGRFADRLGVSLFNDDRPSVTFTGDVRGQEQNLSKVDFDMYWRVWNIMQQQYVDPAKGDEKQMFYDSIKGFVDSFGDPATLFLDPEETADFNQGNAGNLFSGIGAELDYYQKQIVVVSPFKGSPAEAAGVKPGDLILKVDQYEVKPGDSIITVRDMIRGEAGTEVKLTVARQGEQQPLEITIVRNDITVPSMDYEVYGEDKRIGVINLGRFTEADLETWSTKWNGVVSQVKSSGVDGLIIDLRGNPGGFLNAAVYAASDFLPKGEVVLKQEGRTGTQADYKVTREGNLLDIPVVILINGGSASASEIFTGAMKAYDRAEVVGEESYGKGTAQSVIDLEDGSSLHITVSRWLLPDGKWINPDSPVVPDHLVEISDEQFQNGDDPQMDKAVEVIKSKIR